MRAYGVERKRDVNLAFAVALPDGLVAPVIRDAAAAPAATLASEYARLSVGAHDGSLPPKAYQTGTFTVSNLFLGRRGSIGSRPSSTRRRLGSSGWAASRSVGSRAMDRALSPRP